VWRPSIGAQINIQEAFNKVWDWFIVQKNPPGILGLTKCRLRGDNGSKCALGVLIPDSSYDSSMESDPVISARLFLRCESKVKGHEFLCAIRSFHDLSTRSWHGFTFHDEYKWRLKLVAKTFNLQIPEEKKELEVSPVMEEQLIESSM